MYKTYLRWHEILHEVKLDQENRQLGIIFMTSKFFKVLISSLSLLKEGHVRFTTLLDQC